MTCLLPRARCTMTGAYLCLALTSRCALLGLWFRVERICAQQADTLILLSHKAESGKRYVQGPMWFSAWLAGGANGVKAACSTFLQWSQCRFASLNFAVAVSVFTQGLGYVDSTPTPNLQAALKLKAGIVTSGGCQQYCC